MSVVSKRARKLRRRVSHWPRWWGVWCVEDRTWCPALAAPFRGTLAEAFVEIEHWRSGERAAVAPRSFRYEVMPLRGQAHGA